jgi:hypothetical protein
MCIPDRKHIMLMISFAQAKAASMPKRKRPKLDAIKLLGNRRLTTNHVRAVLEALPTYDGHSLENINVDKEFARAIEELYDKDLALNLQLNLNDGNTFDWPVARPGALVRSLVCVSPALRRAIDMVPSSFDQPWSIVLYLDEITPGNISAPMNSRTRGVGGA